MPVTPPAPYAARPATAADAVEMAALANDTALALVGERVTDGDELRGELAAPGPPADRRSVVVEGPDRELAAFALLFSTPPSIEVMAFGDVQPAHRGRGLGSYLVARAGELAAALAPGAAAVLRWDVWEGHDELGALLGGHGFAPVRHFWRMRLALDDAPLAAEWPAGLVVRTFRPGDETRVHAALGEAFRGNWGHAEPPLERFVHDRIEGAGAQFDPTLWFLALEGDEVAGVALCRSEDASEPGAGYVGELGVRPAWRRRGLALALLRHAFGEFHRRGQPAVALHVDAANPTGALRLYEQAGMTALPRYALWEVTVTPAGAARG